MQGFYWRGNCQIEGIDVYIQNLSSDMIELFCRIVEIQKRSISIQIYSLYYYFSFVYFIVRLKLLTSLNFSPKLNIIGTKFLRNFIIIFEFIIYFIEGNMNKQYQEDEYMFEQREQNQVKNQYSTFIQQLEQTTEKLMDQVFNSEYQPDQQNYVDQQNIQIGDRIDQRWSQARTGKNRSIPITEQNYGKFTGFLLRSQKWIQNKERNRQKQETKKDNMVESTITELPRILRGSIQKLDPIWIRTYQIQHHKHQKHAIKRIDKKKQEQQEINNISFKPQVNKKSKNQVPRTLQQYIRDKQQWVKRKNQKIKVKKLLTQASKYEQCIFQPILETKRYNQRHLIAYQSQKVEERLLRSLQKSTEKKASRANKL